MKTIELLSLPKVKFAHVYRAETYENHFRIRKNSIEVSYLAEGSLSIEAGTEKVCAQKGDIICLRRSEESAILAAAPHCHHTVCAAVEWAFSEDMLNQLYLPVVTSAQGDTAHICRLIDQFIHKPDLYKNATAKGAAKFLELLCAIDQCNRKAGGFKLPGELLYTQKAKNYVQNNLHRPITQAEIAAHLGITSGYLCGIFKKTEGTTLMRYINKTKLEGLKSLMERENIPLYEAAALYGYHDANYVSRLFKQLFGYNITDKPLIYPELQ